MNILALLKCIHLNSGIPNHWLFRITRVFLFDILNKLPIYYFEKKYKVKIRFNK